jgi:flagellar hook-associated protein 1 FlgK
MCIRDRGPNGTPADLGKLGFDTRISVKGGTTDDLLVFVTDSSGAASSASVSAQFDGIEGSMKQTLRASPLKVTFTSDTSYNILDTRTDTVVAERQLAIDPNNTIPSLTYRGLRLEFSTAPKKGDVFSIDGNKDGIGNNETMLRMVALEDETVMPGGLTITEAYIERVNQVGSVARQSAIAEQALTVVYQQAQEARDGISGVSLDQEASALVRFQQAYQANAKVMQVSMALFDAILQVR